MRTNLADESDVSTIRKRQYAVDNLVRHCVDNAHAPRIASEMTNVFRNCLQREGVTFGMMSRRASLPCEASEYPARTGAGRQHLVGCSQIKTKMANQSIGIAGSRMVSDVHVVINELCRLPSTDVAHPPNQ